jgi:hypothetical protein
MRQLEIRGTPSQRLLGTSDVPSYRPHFACHRSCFTTAVVPSESAVTGTSSFHFWTCWQCCWCNSMRYVGFSHHAKTTSKAWACFLGSCLDRSLDVNGLRSDKEPASGLVRTQKKGRTQASTSKSCQCMLIFLIYDLFYSRNQAVHIVSLPLFFCNLSII